MINHAEKDPLEVHKVDTALELIELLRGTHNRWRGHREQWGFRGQADSKWRLVPSAFRDGWEASLPKCLRSPAEEAIVRQQHNEWEAFLRFFRLADETGLYVPPGDVAAMRRAIEKLLDDPEAAVAMGRRGRDFARTHADVRVYAARIADVVRSHLSAGPADADADSDGPAPVPV